MRQQQAIGAASGPRTPIDDPTSNRIGVLRNGGDSGIFTAAGQLRPLSSSTVTVRTQGRLQFCPMRQVVVGPAADDGAMRCSDRRQPPAPFGPFRIHIPNLTAEVDGCVFGR